MKMVSLVWRENKFSVGRVVDHMRSRMAATLNQW